MTNSTQEIILNAKVAKTMSNHSLQTTTVASGVVGTPAAMKYRETPYTWDGVVDIIERKQDLSLLVRSAEQHRVYMAYSDALRREWKTMYDYILHSKFGFQKRIVSSTSKEGGAVSADAFDTEKIITWEAFPSLEEVVSSQTSLCRNDFPYNFEDNIEHWCLWKLCGSVTPDEIDDAKQKLKNMGNVSKTLHWVNPPHLQSLPGINHAHILCLRKGVEDDCSKDDSL
uniref:Uncharacterized protein n=1 Tax=Ditylum brightwellii TaxID=49249 RepID=A0A6V2MH38_9STRA